MIDYSAPSGIAEEGVLIVYDEAVKIRALVLIFKVEHRIQQQKQRPEHSSIFSFKLMHVKDSITNQKRNHPLLKRKKSIGRERKTNINNTGHHQIFILLSFSLQGSLDVLVFSV